MISARTATPKMPRGFTLIELLISIAIIGILTAIVIVRYGAFDSTVLLKSTAYEIGLNLREAQVRSVSASRVGTGFAVPFGVSFDIGSTGSNKQYHLFADSENEGTPPQYDDFSELIQTVEIGRTMQIDRISVYNGADRDATLLDISFKRPEYKSLIYAENNGTPILNVTDATIYVSSTGNSTNKFSVTVSQLGQINVKAE